MSKKTLVPSVELVTIFVYAIVSIATNYVGCLTYIISALMFRGSQKSIASLIILAVLPMIVAVLLSSIYMRKCINDQYVYSEGKVSWLRNFLIFIMPGEILRFLISLLDLGHSSGTGRIAFTPSFAFENIYIYQLGLNTRIRIEMNYQLSDFLAYIACYIVYLFVYVSLLLVIYRRFWKKIDVEHRELTRYQSGN